MAHRCLYIIWHTKNAFRTTVGRAGGKFPGKLSDSARAWPWEIEFHTIGTTLDVSVYRKQSKFERAYTVNDRCTYYHIYSVRDLSKSTILMSTCGRFLACANNRMTHEHDIVNQIIDQKKKTLCTLNITFVLGRRRLFGKHVFHTLF